MRPLDRYLNEDKDARWNWEVKQRAWDLKKYERRGRCLETLKKIQGLKGTAGTWLPSAEPHGKVPSHDTVDMSKPPTTALQGRALRRVQLHLFNTLSLMWLDFYQIRQGHGEGNGNPFQYSCLETPRDRGAWWAATYGIAQSRTWLKWLSSSSSSRQGQE